MVIEKREAKELSKKILGHKSCFEIEHFHFEEKKVENATFQSPGQLDGFVCDVNDVECGYVACD